MSDFPQRFDALFFEELFNDPLADQITGRICPPLTEKMIARAEMRLGCKLPATYIAMLRYQNGGTLRYCMYRYRPDKEQSDRLWVYHFYGLGGENSMDAMIKVGSGSDSRLLSGNECMIEECGFPENTVLISSCGHVGYLLDYRECNSQSEPPVLYSCFEHYPDVETYRIASGFDEFIAGLEEL